MQGKVFFRKSKNHLCTSKDKKKRKQIIFLEFYRIVVQIERKTTTTKPTADRIKKG